MLASSGRIGYVVPERCEEDAFCIMPGQFTGRSGQQSTSMKKLKEGIFAGGRSGLATQENEGRLDWSDESKCQACYKEEGAEKHRLYHCPEWYEARREIPKAFRKRKQKARTSKREWKWQRGILTHLLSGEPMEQGSFQCEKVGVGEAQQLGLSSRRV